MVPSEKFKTYSSMWLNTIFVFLYLCQRYTVFHLLIKTRGPQALMVTWVSETFTDFLSKGLIFVYHQPHHRINENLLWYRRAASKSLNTIAIDVLYIDRVEDNTYSLKWLIWPRPNIRTSAMGVLKFTILIDPSLVIIMIYLVCLIYAWE